MLTTEDTEAATPETDAAERMAYSQEYMVPTDFARRLERERNEAIRQRDETNRSSKHSCDYNYEQKLQAERERDEARRASRKFLKEVLLVIDSGDWKAFMESRETARRLLEEWQ